MAVLDYLFVLAKELPALVNIVVRYGIEFVTHVLGIFNAM